MTAKAFFFQRMNDHVRYLKMIQATLDGKGDFQGTDYHDCKLGNWLYDTGPAEAAAVGNEAKAMFDTLIEPHQRFHDISQEAVQKHLAGDSDGARLAVTEMYKLSNTLVNILLKLDSLSN